MTSAAQNPPLNLWLAPCPDYQPERLNVIVDSLLAKFLAAKSWSLAGKKVFLKVNLLGAYPPERAVTTHPALVTAAIKALLAQGAQVYVGDSPGGFPKPVYMDKVFRATGMIEVCEATGATLLNLSAEKTAPRLISSRFIRELHLPQILAEFDYIISLPKVKTHTLTLYTGAVKNLFGCVPGFYKSEIHRLAAKAAALSEFLVDLYQLLPPVFTIADAITVMEGEGPSGGSPRQLGVILAGENAFTVDAAAAYLLGYEPEEIHTLRIGAQRNLGEISTAVILTAVPELAKYRQHCKLPRLSFTRQLIEQAAFLGGGVVKPKVILEKCRLCQFCAQSCPTQAISVKEKNLNFAYDKCIRCLCCQELCPQQAIYLERSWLSRAINVVFHYYQKIKKHLF